MRRRYKGTAAFAVVALVLLVGAAGTFAAVMFSDVPASHPFSADIERLAGLNIIAGFPDGTFKPDSQVTRQQFAKMI
ncbi:MAG: S-layer homology domain-containing protein, partial [Thermoleophilia bacterium]